MRGSNSDTALVTGGSGFIGTKLREHLQTQDVRVLNADLPDNDILQTGHLTALVAAHRPRWIFHLAAQANVGESWQDPYGTWNSNLLGTASLLEAARRAAPDARVVVASSASVFEGNTKTEPITEDMPPAPRSPYAYSKAAIELICSHYVNEHSLAVVIARPFNVIGPGQSERYVVPSLADRVLTAEQSADPQVEIGDGESVRDFVDVRDAARCLHLLAVRASPGRRYNVCSGRGRTIQSVAHRLAELAGIAIVLRRSSELVSRAGENKLVGDPRRTAEEIGWRPTVDFDSTLRQVLDEARLRRADRNAADRAS